MVETFFGSSKRGAESLDRDLLKKPTAGFLRREIFLTSGCNNLAH
jgi:hypothetical protein